MKFNEENNNENYTIKAYRAGEITVVGPAGPGALPEARVLTASFVIGPRQLLTDWPPQQVAELAPEHFAPLLAMEPELVLLGCGAQLRFPDPAVLEPLMRHGIGFEAMDSAAACRTYNILMGEGRRVVAAIFML